MQIEPRRFSDWTSRSVSAVWRAYDLQLTTYAALLGAVGLVMAYSNTVGDGTALLAPDSTFGRGLMWAGIAIVAFLVATAFDYRWLKTFRWPLYFGNLGLLVVTLAIGDGVGGAARWVALGPITFQFSELAKILMIAVLAAYLGSREGKLDSLGSILGACVLMGPAVLLVMLQPDLGTSLVFAAILAGMLFLSGANLLWLGLMGIVGLAGAAVSWAYVLRDYQKDRLVSFLDPAHDVHGSGWQLVQSQIAVGSGGLLGAGLTNGTQNRGSFLPVQESDFVAAVLFEELGFVGAILLFLLFGALLWRIMASGWKSRDPFGTMFCAGLASALLFQMFVNLGMVIGIMPITGIPLPFVSHGGASLVSIALGLGLVQSINIRQHERVDW